MLFLSTTKSSVSVLAPIQPLSVVVLEYSKITRHTIILEAFVYCFISEHLVAGTYF